MEELYDEVLLDLYSNRESNNTYKNLEKYLLYLDMTSLAVDNGFSNSKIHDSHIEKIWVLITMTSYLGTHNQYRLKMQSILLKWSPGYLNIIVNSAGLNNQLFEADINNFEEFHVVRKYSANNMLSTYIMKEDVSYANIMYKYGNEKVINLLLDDLMECVGKTVVLSLCLNILFSDKVRGFEIETKNKINHIIELHSYKDINEFIQIFSHNEEDKKINQKIAYLEELVLRLN